MKYCYQAFNFRDIALGLIEYANEIIKEYQADGYDLTLRQLYYVFVARDYLPEKWRDPVTGSKNNPKSYGKLGSIISKARLAGLIDWKAIVDRTRHVEINSHWEDPSDIIQSSADCYALDSRIDQDVYIEAWIEKEALAGILERACEPLDIPYFSCRGYVSLSAMWRAARRIRSQPHNKTVILHLGDHDPSGIDMTRDIRDRLELFNCDIEVKRIALNMDQVKEHKPPPNPAKMTDSRFQSYADEYGDESWELDALDPRTITELIESHAAELTDERKRKRRFIRQEKNRKRLQAIADNYDDLDI